MARKKSEKQDSHDMDDIEVMDKEAQVSTEEVEDQQEEITLGEDFQKSLDATQMYLSEIGFSPLLSAEEEVFFHEKRCEVAMHPANA